MTTETPHGFCLHPWCIQPRIPKSLAIIDNYQAIHSPDFNEYYNCGWCIFCHAKYMKHSRPGELSIGSDFPEDWLSQSRQNETRLVRTEILIEAQRPSNRIFACPGAPPYHLPQPSSSTRSTERRDNKRFLDELEAHAAFTRDPRVRQRVEIKRDLDEDYPPVEQEGSAAEEGEIEASEDEDEDEGEGGPDDDSSSIPPSKEDDSSTPDDDDDQDDDDQGDNTTSGSPDSTTRRLAWDAARSPSPDFSDLGTEDGTDDANLDANLGDLNNPNHEHYHAHEEFVRFYDPYWPLRCWECEDAVSPLRSGGYVQCVWCRGPYAAIYCINCTGAPKRRYATCDGHLFNHIVAHPIGVD